MKQALMLPSHVPDWCTYQAWPLAEGSGRHAPCRCRWVCPMQLVWLQQAAGLWCAAWAGRGLSTCQPPPPPLPPI